MSDGSLFNPGRLTLQVPNLGEDLWQAMATMDSVSGKTRICVVGEPRSVKDEQCVYFPDARGCSFCFILFYLRVVVPGYASGFCTAAKQRGMVVSAHPKASEAGQSMLRRGGQCCGCSSSSLAISVVEPFCSWDWGGGFCCYTGRRDESTRLPQTPLAGYTRYVPR